MNGFLPVTKEEMIALGWDSPDFVYVSGDAYVDHPSFGHAIIARQLWCSYNYTCAGISRISGVYAVAA